MISLADLKLAIRAKTGSAEDDYLTALEAAAVAYLERETHRYFGAAANATEWHRGMGTSTLFLREAPSAIPTTVTERVDPGDQDPTTVTASASDGYTLRGRRLIRKDGVWVRGYEYEVTYARGYASGAEPADVRQAVTQLVALAYEQRLPLVVGTVAFPVPHSVQRVIDTWRRQLA